jgi:hypothetical protein
LTAWASREAGCWRRRRRPRRSFSGSRRWISARPSWCAASGCLVRAGGASGREEVGTYKTMTRSLLVLADRLAELGVTRVVMEATSDYWRPVVRHEAPRIRAEVKGLRRWPVAAGR